VPGKGSKERYDGQPLGWFVRSELQKAERVARGKKQPQCALRATIPGSSSAQRQGCPSGSLGSVIGDRADHLTRQVTGGPQLRARLTSGARHHDPRQ
jgi:hypothetical protein